MTNQRITKEGIELHPEEDFRCMRKAGKLAAQVLDMITEHVQPSVTTEELDKICHDMIIANNAIPAPLNYRGFPKSICTSVNHVVCHGIPSDKKKLKEGDILNIDVTVIVDGWHGDSSRMYYVGTPPIKAQRLCQVAHDSMMKAIEIIKPGIKTGDLGHIIQSYVEDIGYSSVRDYCGHGIGKVFHTLPNIMHFGKKDTGIVLQEGMFFTVEPMINAGSYETLLNKYDGWTVWTKDKKLSAQFEHTVAVTKDGFEIFTLSEKGYTCPPYS